MAVADVAISEWFHAHGHPAITQIMLLITHMHGTWGICILAAGLAILLELRRLRWWLLALALCVPGGLILNAAVKQIFRRARPHFDEPLLTLTTYSFPSGHAAGATVFYGFLVALLLAHVQERRRRVAIVTGAILMVSLAGLSRVYLGVHYLSDVIAAFIEGVLWLTLCLTVVRALEHRSNVGKA